MIPIDQAPRYVEETAVMAARLQEQTTPAQYEALGARARRLVEDLLSVETGVPLEVRVKIALREKFDPERTRQAILAVATWSLFSGLGKAKNVRTAPAAAAWPRPATPAPAMAMAAR
jgi:hypothetical protein